MGTKMAKQVRGNELKLGDVIDTWAGKKRIIALQPYRGPLAYLFPAGAQIATFDLGGGMTIDNSDLFEIASFEAA
jgi:hypothetical protein